MVRRSFQDTFTPLSKVNKRRNTVKMRDMAPAQSTRLNLIIKSEVSVLGRCNARVTEIIAVIVTGTCSKKALE